MQAPYRPFGDPPRQRRWGFVSWWFSLILIVPIVGLIGTLAYHQFMGSGGLDGVVLDAYSEKPLSGATISVGTRQLTSDARGQFEVARDTTEIQVTHDGYDPARVSVDQNNDKKIEVLLRPNVVQGVVTNSANQEPIAGITVEARVGKDVATSAKTDANGQYILRDVPENATVVIDSPDYSDVSTAIERRSTIDLAVRPDVMTGKVTDAQGKPVAGATVAVGKAIAMTGADGTYRLEGAPESGELVFKAPGFKANSVQLDGNTTANAKLESFNSRGIYITAETASRPDDLQPLLDMVGKTELNSVIVDLKDSSGSVFYDTQVQLAREIGAVKPLFDPAELVATLHQQGIYAIARIVVFEDPMLAEKRPEWAIQAKGGGLWRTWNGLAWVNAHRSEVWDYDIALAKEAASFGFDEVQLDYIRFPTDGPLDQADYGVEQNPETRAAAITTFLTKAHEALAPTTTYLGVDVFGLTLWELGDGGIGQHLEDIVPVVDYVCPMIYPSHFGAGSMGFDIPNDHPYEVILWSLQNGAERMPNAAAKLRPWLQDFSLGAGISYGDSEVRQQIKASDDFGASGWMLWNAGNVYHEAALSTGAPA